MLDLHSDTAHVQGWQFVTSIVESKALDSSSVRMVQMQFRQITINNVKGLNYAIIKSSET
jgi:hypothetical protein